MGRDGHVPSPSPFCRAVRLVVMLWVDGPLDLALVCDGPGPGGCPGPRLGCGVMHGVSWRVLGSLWVVAPAVEARSVSLVAGWFGLGFGSGSGPEIGWVAIRGHCGLCWPLSFA